MSRPYLEVTYRKGKPFAAYLYLVRQSGDKSTRTVKRGSLVIDYAQDGRSIGIEIPTITATAVDDVMQALREMSVDESAREELEPLAHV